MADFLSSLVHELRTPLTSMRGALTLLAGAAVGAPDEMREFSAIADRNASRLSSLLDDVAAYARLQLPECAVSPAVVDLTSLMERAVDRAQPVAESRGVTIEVQRPPFDAFADETLLLDAIGRMVFYAVRVTPRDGMVRLSAESADGRTVVRVEDQGRPVRDEDLDRLFEPFSPVARRGVDSADRAGLDLAIARLVAIRHEGSFEYRQITAGGVVRLTLGPSSQRPARGLRAPEPG